MAVRRMLVVRGLAAYGWLLLRLDLPDPDILEAHGLAVILEGERQFLRVR